MTSMCAALIWCVRIFFFMARSADVPALTQRLDIGAAAVWAACAVSTVVSRAHIMKSAKEMGAGDWDIFSVFCVNLSVCTLCAVAFAFRAYSYTPPTSRAVKRLGSPHIIDASLDANDDGRVTRSEARAARK